ncbi:hypothetical protein ACYZX9_03665 [Sphingomonas citri]
MPTRTELEALKPGYLKEHPRWVGKTRWSRGKRLKEGVEAKKAREAAHRHVRQILILWAAGWTIKQMAWKLKAPMMSVQWIVRKAIDAGHVEPDLARLRWPPEPRLEQSSPPK